MSEKRSQVLVLLPADAMARLDDWCAKQRPIPTRAEALRTLALKAIGSSAVPDLQPMKLDALISQLEDARDEAAMMPSVLSSANKETLWNAIRGHREQAHKVRTMIESMLHQLGRATKRRRSTRELLGE